MEKTNFLTWITIFDTTSLANNKITEEIKLLYEKLEISFFSLVGNSNLIPNWTTFTGNM